jgi:hypothetical protein
MTVLLSGTDSFVLLSSVPSACWLGEGHDVLAFS